MRSATGWSGMDPRPRKRIVGSQGWWKAQHRRKTGRCSLCRRTAKTSWHHLVDRSLGGDDIEVNLIELCGGGTTGCHGDITGWLKDARCRLREKLTVEQMRYMAERKGPDWVDRYYPKEKA